MIKRIREWAWKNHWTMRGDPWSEVFIFVIIPGLYAVTAWLLILVMCGDL